MFFPLIPARQNDAKGSVHRLDGSLCRSGQGALPALSDQATAPPKAHVGIRLQTESYLSAVFGPFLKDKPLCLGGGQLRLPVGQPVGNLPELHRIAGIEFRI